MTADMPSYDLVQVKDSNGRTILHLAAARPQKQATLYKMLAQCSYLIAERDADYRSIREVRSQSTSDKLPLSLLELFPNQ